ncbi:hydroxymethylglutaryl-CoA reductase [Fructobacillus sp. M1-13]|uniref:Hydroxymethylglutaryl-CoA reductase n=1 Tax=Fructobacillus papyriferae TaxID=2713171 RepID=A0ABS5QS89_9LACO|nr:hydroxymethylglutaryl-CoA reductase [Fructobacillus papyriferae]MBS9335236.1 hydroxymethylglutaryl-CoA reductase [Fructobacillus papyriferae]MCD2159095.1 hydroxymethylglutaryl-CoA reductase [Fructobacillus papyriferae]
MSEKFYQLSPEKRLEKMTTDESLQRFFLARQSSEMPDLIENYVADFKLPEGVLPDLTVNEKHYRVPMVVEEPSVVAAAANGARMVALGGGFQEEGQSQALVGGQLLFLDADLDALGEYIEANEAAIFETAALAKPSLVARGDGLKKVDFRIIDQRHSVLELSVQSGKAMGANAVNTILEAVKDVMAPFSEKLVGAILTNAGHGAEVSVSAQLPVEIVGGIKAAERIVSLSEFGKVDSDRAVTENKGIFNGLSAVLLATGNDYRAVEAAGHAFASQSGHYQSLSSWQLSADQKFLQGRLTLPLNIGILGGAIGALPMAQKNLELMGNPTVAELKAIMLSVGLANNLAALKAVSGKGIQEGHMRMQARALAIQVGASGSEVNRVADRLAKEKTIDEKTATRILGEERQHDA